MLRLDYEALADSSRTLIEQGDIFEECIERMTQVIDALPDIAEAIWTRYMPSRNMIQEMAEQMQKISDNFREADADMAGQM